MTVNSIAKNYMSDAMTKLSTMKRINSAADDASGLAIMEKMESQVRGLDQGTDNTLDMKNLVSTAEGALSSIDDGLQRVRELSVQAANGIYNDSDRALIQNEVSQLIQGISSVAKDTEFNKQKLLDGSFTNKNTASSPDGTGASISLPDMGPLALGLQGYNVTDPVTRNVQTQDENGNLSSQSVQSYGDLDTIDNAISFVNSTRSYIGAIENRFDHTVNSNNISMLNLAASKSRIADLDAAKGASDLNKARILSEMSAYNQRNQQDRMKTQLSFLM